MTEEMDVSKNKTRDPTNSLLFLICTLSPLRINRAATPKLSIPAAKNFETFTGSATGPTTMNTVMKAEPIASNLISVFSMVLFSMLESYFIGNAKTRPPRKREPGFGSDLDQIKGC
jgi:hypothetical protein